MEACKRANRSDIHLSVEEEAKKEEETREYFDGIAPKRHTKPQRSDYSTQYVDALPTNGFIPEYVEFQRLETDPQVGFFFFFGGELCVKFMRNYVYNNCLFLELAFTLVKQTMMLFSGIYRHVMFGFTSWSFMGWILALFLVSFCL